MVAATSAPAPPPAQQQITHFDQVFSRIRQFGAYQLLVLLSIQCAMLTSAGNYIFLSFATLRPDCAKSAGQHEDNGGDVCSRISAHCVPSNGSASPSSLSPLSVPFRSVYAEPHFVCPHSHLPHHLQTLQAIGSAIGAILGGHLADAVGRTRVTSASALAMAIAGLCGSMSPSWHFLALAMFCMGLAYGAFVDAAMTLAAETVGPKYRIVQTLAFQWSVAFQICALIAFLTADWRLYLLLLNALSLPPLLFIALFWRESPRWLIQRGRMEQACTELNAIARINGCKAAFTPNDLAGIVPQNEPTGERPTVYSVWHLFHTRRTCAYSLVMIFSALTVEMAVSVIIFDVQALAGNPFLNVALYGLLRLWVPFFVVLLERRAQWFGRRVLFLSSQAFSSLCFLVILASLVLFPSTPASSDSAVGVVRTVCALLGGIVNSSLFFTVYKQFSLELFPTPMRAMAVGAFGVVERIGGALAPQLVAMNHLVWAGSALSATTLLCLLSMLSGAAILPETRDADMPDVVEEERRPAEKGAK